MASYDDDLKNFEAHGAAALPVPSKQDYSTTTVLESGTATYGSGSPVILLHGGLGHGGNWGYQVPALVELWASRRAHRQPRPWPQYARFAAL